MEYKRILLPLKLKKGILALGSQTKNTICLAQGSLAYFSGVHADLNQAADFLKFEQDLTRFLRQRPKVIVYDLHPEYQSTKFAHTLSPNIYRIIPIQHHHAHVASCMAENNLKNQKVIGVVFDGTGLGGDNSLWGAEFFICNYAQYARKAHLRYIPLLGAERAIEEPWRLAMLWLYLIYKEKALALKIDFIKKIDRKKWMVLKSMYDSGFNSPLASSMGRLFDAVASLVLNKFKVKFEAEAARELEKVATNYKLQAAGYRFKIIKAKEDCIIDPQPMFQEIIDDLRAKEAKGKIAYRFHLTVAEMIGKICLDLRKETKINQVILSGGVFQNRLLLKLSLDLLSKAGFNVFTHHKLSCSDSGISLGQVMIGNFSRRAQTRRDPAGEL